MATLNISDLSVGDWVINHRGYPTKVQVITSDGNLLCGELDAKSEHCTHLWVQDIKPIPITAEVLEKNGFELFSRDIKYITYCINESQISVSYVKDTKEWMVFLGASGSVKKKFVEVSCVKYIHELQHALRLCGIEKEIEL